MPLERSERIAFFARTNFRDERKTFGIKRQDRRAHMYVIGKTGTGKSTLLETLITQDIKHGEGVALLDPHGDLAEKVLQNIPEHRKGDLLYFDPIASEPLGFNPLENVPPHRRPLAAAGLLEVFATRSWRFSTSRTPPWVMCSGCSSIPASVAKW
jgi:type IV secretory pathway VirB4 component